MQRVSSDDTIKSDRACLEIPARCGRVTTQALSASTLLRVSSVQRHGHGGPQRHNVRSHSEGTADVPFRNGPPQAQCQTQDSGG